MLNSRRTPTFARSARLAGASLFVAALLAACGTDSAETTVATVDGVKVSLEDLNSGPTPPTPGAGAGTLSKASIANSASVFIQQQGPGVEVDVEPEFGFWDAQVGVVKPSIDRFSGSAAAVNGTAIPAEAVFFELDEEASRQEASGAPATLVDTETGRVSVDQAGQITAGLIDAQLIREGLVDRGLAVTDEVREEVRVSLGDVPPGLSQEFADRFVERRAEFQVLRDDLTPESVSVEPFTLETLPPCARHILVATEAEAESVLEQLNDGVDFAALAAQLSIDTNSGAIGGTLGCVPTSAYVIEFGAALEALETGDLSGLVATEFGVHIIERVEPTDADLEQTNLSLQAQADQTSDQNGQLAVQAWFGEAIAAADIELNPLLGTWDAASGVVSPR